MRNALRALLVLGVVATAAPAVADDDIWPDWGYECVRYPCYPEDYIECALAGTCYGEVES